MNESILSQTSIKLNQIKLSEKELLEQADYIGIHGKISEWKSLFQQRVTDPNDEWLLRDMRDFQYCFHLDFYFQNQLEQHCESCKKALEDIESYLDSKPAKIVELQLKLNLGLIHISLFEVKYLQDSMKKAMGNQIYNISKATSKGALNT